MALPNSSIQSGSMTFVFIIPEFMTGIGGIELLVINLASAISVGDNDNRVQVICPRGSFVSEQLTPLQSPRLDLFHWDRRHLTLPKDAILVSWGGYNTLTRFKKTNPALLVWCVFPGQAFNHFKRISEGLPFFRQVFQNAFRATLQYLVEKESVVFMDEPNRLETQTLSEIKMPRSYLPIVVPVSDNLYCRNRVDTKSGSQLCVSWVGRGSADWKVIPLVRFIEDATLPSDGISLTIFTDFTERYEQLFNDRGIGRPGSNISITYRKSQFGSDLRSSLGREFDLHLGMGTSVLEGAAVGVPSVCVDPQSNVHPAASWQWLHERKNYDLGNFDPSNDLRRPFNFAILHMEPAKLLTLSAQCHEYVKTHHDVRVVLQRLFELKPRASLTYYLRSHGALFRAAAVLSRWAAFAKSN